MTSGTFGTIELSSIWVNRQGRQRKELTDIESLADSFRRLGQINPVLIKRETNELIAGERRFEAARLLGWTHIFFQYEDQVDPAQLRLLELEENTRRVDLSWQDQCLAVQEYHLLRKAESPEWSQEQTAASLGMARTEIVEKLSVAKEILNGNTAIAEAPKFSTARGLVRRTEERKASADEEITKLLKVQEIEPTAKAVLNQSFLEWAPLYEGPKFNLIHCDFPYGVNADKQQQGYGPGAHGSYSDTPEDYIQLLDCLLANHNRFLTESAHIVFWFSMKYYKETVHVLQQIFDLDPFPLIWLKSDNIGLLPDPERGPRRIYETALFGSRGDRKVVRAVSNAIAWPRGENTHMSQKPLPVVEHFFRMLVDGSTSLLDPTCGSGTALRAARNLGAQTVLGLEINEEFARRANEEFEKDAAKVLEGAG